MANFFLTEEDKRIVQKALNALRSIRKERKASNRKHKFQSPDIYIALPPGGGIPGLTEAAGTSTDDTPGSADCTIYRIDSDGDFEIYEGLEKTVYNITHVTIPAKRGTSDNWIIVIRSKQGKWLAIDAGGDKLYPIELKTTLALFGTATVILLDDAGAQTAEEETAKDILGFYEGVAGDKGWCERLRDGQLKFVALSCEPPGDEAGT